MLSFGDIETSADIPCASVVCPEWGGEVLVRGLTAAEHLRLAAMAEDPARQQDCVFWAAAFGLLNPGGAQMFPAPEDGVAFLRGRALAPVERIAARVLELSSLSSEAVNAAKKK